MTEIRSSVAISETLLRDREHAVGVMVLAIFVPRVAAFGYLLIGIILVMRAHGDQATPPETAAKPT